MLLTRAAVARPLIAACPCSTLFLRPLGTAVGPQLAAWRVKQPLSIRRRTAAFSSNMPSAAVAPGELPAALQGLQPEALWRHFGELSKLPRPSKHEGR
jgi:hypothetical protein